MNNIRLGGVKTTLQFEVEQRVTSGQLHRIKDELSTEATVFSWLDGFHISVVYNGVYSSQLVKRASECIARHTREED